MFLSLLWIDFPNLSLKDSIFWKFVHVIKLEETNRNSFRLRIFELVKLLKKACRVRRMTGKPHSVNASKNIEFLYVTRMHASGFLISLKWAVPKATSLPGPFPQAKGQALGTRLSRRAKLTHTAEKSAPWTDYSPCGLIRCADASCLWQNLFAHINTLK